MKPEKTLMDELLDYIKKNLKKGYTKESLKWALIDQGYSRIEVDRALKKVDKELADSAPKLETKPQIKYEIVEPEGYKIKVEPKKSFWKKLLGK